MNITLIHEQDIPKREYDTNFTILKYKNFNDLDTQINEMVCDGQCDVIEAPLLSNRLPSLDFGQILKCLVRKLRHNGELRLSGVDVYTICNKLLNSKINVIEFNELLFGRGGAGINTVLDTSEILSELGLKITAKVLDDNHFTVIGKRP